MTSSLPQPVRDVFERFITCEYTTIDSRRQPIVWPVTPYYASGGTAIEVTTGLGYPKKAEDARRNPYVAALFSDSTGSGIESGIRVLVQGTAEIDDDDLVANRERYWRESGEKLPATKDMHPPKLIRGAFNWYYTRLYIRIRPERVFVWPEGDLSSPPELLDAHVEEVRSGHAEEPGGAELSQAGGSIAWDGRIEELGRRYDSAVLAWVAPDGFPIAVRVPVSLDMSTRRIAIDATPEGLPLAEGRACLTAHSHGPRFEWQENFQVRGNLAEDGGRWWLEPHRLIGGFELPDESALAGMRRNAGKSWRFYKTARAYKR